MKKLFLYYWLFTCLTLVASALLFYLGIFGFIWNNDSTFISYIIIGLYTYSSVWVGWKCWSLSRLENSLSKEDIIKQCNKSERLESWGWYISSQLISLGLLGTALGLLFSFASFGGADVSNPAEMKKLIQQIGGGISTALITTIVGILCSLLLRFQYFLLGNEIKSIRNKL